MRQLLSFLLSLSFMMSSVAGAAPLCAEVHSQNSKDGSMVQVQPMPMIGSSYLKVQPLRLKENAEGLATLIHLLAQTSGIKLDPKLLDKKNELVLGLLIPNSAFSLEMEYKADGRFGKKLILQEIVLISPTSSRRVITKQVFKPEAFELVNEGVFELKDGFPAGLEVKSQIPLIIDQKLMDEFEKFYPNVEHFNNAEIRKMTKDRKVNSLNLISQFRKLKEIAKEVFIKLPFKQFGNVLVTVFIVSKLMSPGQEPKVIVQSVEAPKPAQMQWVFGMNVGFDAKISPEMRSEMFLLHQEIYSQMEKRKAANPSNYSMSVPKLGDTVFVWLQESEQNNLTTIVFARKTGLAEMEMFFVPIDPAKYPNVVSALKNQNRQVKVQ